MTETLYLHLYQYGLELAETGVVVLVMNRLNCSSSHNRGNVGENVAQARIEDQSIDWLLECLRAEEGNGDESSSQ